MDLIAALSRFFSDTSQAAPDGLHYRLRVSVWVRWFLLVAWLAQYNYRPDFGDPNYVPNTLFAVALLALNGYVHYRIRSNKVVTWHWMLVLSGMDAAMITAGLQTSGGFNNSYFVLYYPALAMFAAVFTSFQLSFAWATMIGAAYTLLSLTIEPGLDFEANEEKILFTRIVVMYAVVLSVNLISRFERIRRVEAVQRERDLQQERIDLSQNIHDTVAQSAYLMELGLETSVKMAGSLKGECRDELLAKMSAILELSKTTIWELRHPIEAGPIFEGRELGSVLRSHATAFSAITSIPTEFDQVGQEPELPVLTKSLLLSIAHNAMTNAYLHSNASRVRLSLSFEGTGLRMAVADDGTGLPPDYSERGHGFAGMRTAIGRIGGSLEVSCGATGKGTVVTGVIPHVSTHGGPEVEAA